MLVCLQSQFAGIVKIMRPKQWIKNSFVLPPLIFSSQFLNPLAVANTIWAFLFFCIASSTAYIVNDIYDIDSDRLHPHKVNTRPLAAKQLSIAVALWLLVILYILLLIVSFFLPKATANISITGRCLRIIV